MADNYRFDCNGKILYLNGILILRQGLDFADCEAIAELHREKDFLIQAMASFDSTDIKLIRATNDLITDVTFRLQDAWGFPRNKDYHRHWEVPHCSCPFSDNLFGFPHQHFYADDCPVHGK